MAIKSVLSYLWTILVAVSATLAVVEGRKPEDHVPPIIAAALAITVIYIVTLHLKQKIEQDDLVPHCVLLLVVMVATAVIYYLLLC